MGIVSVDHSYMKRCFTVEARNQKEQMSVMGAEETQCQYTIRCWSLAWKGCCEVFAG
jgi:hypothetical protein